ncbi:MAG: hypothetical protein K2K21_11990 [Lachnospiraceae bacterium]|nr:hypothetical protein [Lachnospiraceae bacterium]
MSIIEIDTGEKIEKYEYIGEDIDTYIVSSDDIDLSKEGFILKQGKYSRNPVEIKCKLVNKVDVIRRYDDWTKARSYFYGIRCTYKEMDGFIRIEPFESEVPQELMNEFIYEEYLFDRGDQYPPMERHRYYMDISYDDVRFQRDVITKYHDDYIVNLHGITKNMNEEERKQLLIEYLIKKIDKRESDCFRPLLFGSYGYRIPDKLYSTDLDLVFDKVLPRAFELCSTGEHSRSNFLRDLMNSIVNSHWSLGHKGKFASDMLWFEDGKIIYPSKDYAYFMNIQFHLRLMDKHKNQEYPYNLLDLKNVYHWLESSYGEYMTRHNPVYWNNKLICDDLGDYVKKAKKKLRYFKRFGRIKPTEYLRTHIYKRKKMRIIEINKHQRKNMKVEYTDKNNNTYIVNYDDIVISPEGFALKKGASKIKIVKKK